MFLFCFFASSTINIHVTNEIQGDTVTDIYVSTLKDAFKEIEDISVKNPVVNVLLEQNKMVIDETIELDEDLAASKSKILVSSENGTIITGEKMLNFKEKIDGMLTYELNDEFENLPRAIWVDGKVSYPNSMYSPLEVQTIEQLDDCFELKLEESEKITNFLQNVKPEKNPIIKIQFDSCKLLLPIINVNETLCNITCAAPDNFDLNNYGIIAVFIENLDTLETNPGEFYTDEETLYYKPRDDDSPQPNITVPCACCVMNFNEQNNIEFRNVAFSHVSDEIIKIEKSKSITFVDCAFYGCYGNGLVISKSIDVDLINCSIFEMGKESLKVINSENVNVKFCVIENEMYPPCGDGTVCIYDTISASVIGTNIYNTRLSGIVLKDSENIQLAWNKVSFIGMDMINQTNAIDIADCNKVTISNNNISNVYGNRRGIGISCLTTNNVVMSSNMVSYTSSGSCYIIDTNITIENNIFAFCEDVQFNFYSDKIIFTKNIVITNEYPIIKSVAPTLEMNNNIYYNYGDLEKLFNLMTFEDFVEETGKEKNSLYDNPYFVDPKNMNFNITDKKLIEEVGITPFTSNEEMMVTWNKERTVLNLHREYLPHIIYEKFGLNYSVLGMNSKIISEDWDSVIETSKYYKSYPFSLKLKDHLSLIIDLPYYSKTTNISMYLKADKDAMFAASITIKSKTGKLITTRLTKNYINYKTKYNATNWNEFIFVINENSWCFILNYDVVKKPQNLEFGEPEKIIIDIKEIDNGELYLDDIKQTFVRHMIKVITHSSDDDDDDDKGGGNGGGGIFMTTMASTLLPDDDDNSEGASLQTVVGVVLGSILSVAVAFAVVLSITVYINKRRDSWSSSTDDSSSQQSSFSTASDENDDTFESATIYF